jgi:phosphatidylinositol-3-phosphatase
MLENHSYNQVIGNSAAPYENELPSDCGNATQAYGAAHSSAANYLATSAGQYPAASPNGCGYTTCANSEPNIYQQLDSAGLTWKAYEESMPSSCDKSDSSPYKIGHNPPIFYTGISAAECQSNDIGVPSLTATSDAFWDDLQAGTLPAVSWITPNTSNNGESSCGGSCALSAADTWLESFMANVTASDEYQAGNTLVLISYDEGAGSGYAIGEACTNEAADLSGSQPSCQVPLLVIYPYTPAGNDSTYFDHYSITKAEAYSPTVTFNPKLI